MILNLLWHSSRIRLHHIQEDSQFVSGFRWELVQQRLEYLGIEVDLLCLGCVQPLWNNYVIKVRYVARIARKLYPIKIADLL